MSIDLRDHCTALLITPPPVVLPQVILAEDVSDKTKASSERIALLFTSAIGEVFWRPGAKTSPGRAKWRAFTLRVIRLTADLYLRPRLSAPSSGLSSAGMDLVVSSVRQAETFLDEFCTRPNELRTRQVEVLRAPVASLTRIAVQHFAPPDEVLRVRLIDLGKSVVDWTAVMALRPESLMTVLLGLRFPYGAGDELKWSLVEAMKAKQPRLSKELGGRILHCVDLMLSTLTGLRYAAGKVASKALKKYDIDIGAYCLTAIDDVLTSDNSKAVPLLEELVKSLAAPTAPKEAVAVATKLTPEAGAATKKQEEERQKKALEAAIDQDLCRFVRYLVHEDPKESKVIKAVTDDLIKHLKPLMVDLILKRQERVAEHLLFHYLPPALMDPLISLPKPKYAPTLEPSPIAKQIGQLSAEIAAGYLWREDEESLGGFRTIFIHTVQTTAQQIAHMFLGGQAVVDQDQNALRSGRTLMMLHMFLEDYRTGVYRAPIHPNAEVIQPQLTILDGLLSDKYPKSPDHQTLLRDMFLQDFRQRVVRGAVQPATIDLPASLLDLLRVSFPDSGEKFIEHYRLAVCEAQAAFDVALTKPLLDVVREVMAHKYQNDPKLQKCFVDLTSDGVETFFDTVLNPRTVCNLIRTFDFPKPGQKRTSTVPTPTPKDAVPSPVASDNLHAPFGKAIVRTLRSFLRLGHQMGIVNKSAVGLANMCHETIGKKVLTAESGNQLKMVHQLLFKRGGEHAGEARLFVDWIEDEAELKAAVRTWIQDKLIPYLKGEVASSAPWGTQWFVNWKIDAIVPALAEQIEEIIWDPKKRALKILFFHYIFPIWKNDIAQGIC